MKKFLKIKYIAIIALVGYLSVSLISSQFSLMTKRQQLSDLQKQKEKVQMEVKELENLLSIEDEKDYVERIARQRLGYSNPNEIIFRDIQSE